jgi:hypothetical protein
MKTRIQFLLLAVSLAALPSIVKAQSAHYPPGIEGIKAASLPPPGIYVRDYNLFYAAEQLNDPAGNKAVGANAFLYANVPRFIWITDWKFLGGSPGVDLLLPLQYTSLKLDGMNYNSSTFGIGDFCIEPQLSWHPKQWDLAAAYAIWMPTGDSPTKASPLPCTRAGHGFWTHMLTAGATWYIDPDKTWAVSALNRYEINSEQRDTHITPGQAYTLEWGVSKTLAKVVDLGAVGYYQQQVTPSTGAPASRRDRVAAVGPEVSVAFPKIMFFASLRYNYEFMAENRLQGHAVSLTLTKRF